MSIIGLQAVARSMKAVKNAQAQPVPKVIAVSFQRKDTKQFSKCQFEGWRNALSFARWVANSPELELIHLDVAK